MITWNWIKGQRFKVKGVEYQIVYVHGWWNDEPDYIEFKTIYTDDQEAKYYTMQYKEFKEKVTYKNAI